MVDSTMCVLKTHSPKFSFERGGLVNDENGIAEHRGLTDMGVIPMHLVCE